ncbi:MAG: hypothetical protein HY320_01190 [Armatimonadetes bacterium]|nr:hypothetical protein [Armatimonadota bacterium]
MVSIVELLDSITARRPDGPLPADAVSPVPWTMLAEWLRSPEDEGKTFEQRTQVVMPDGTEKGEATIRFSMTARRHRNKTNVNGFPMGQEGEYILRLSLREVAEGACWQVVAEYPVLVSHADMAGA